MLKLAIIDDYAGAALQAANWNSLKGIAEITVFREHLDERHAASALRPFDVVCTMRERMALPRSLFAQLPKLKLITIVGMRIANLDMAAATDHGVLVVHSNLDRPAFAAVSDATPELAWGLVIATVRNIGFEDRSVRAGGWQTTTGLILKGRTLGLLGLGRTGRRVAEYGRVFGMNVIAWSENLSAQTATEAGVERVEKDELFARADVLSIHTVLSERTRDIVGGRELGLMKRGSCLVNTSRGPIVNEAALVAALRSGHLGGAGLDVFDHEPVAADHPLCGIDNVTLTPHLGYSTKETLSAFYGDMPEAIAAFARGAPIRVINPEALGHGRQRNGAT